MKKPSFFLISALVLLLVGIAMQSCTTAASKEAKFLSFEYKGTNDVANPILQGFYPDPSICKKGDDYFLVCSSFVFYPGIPIFHSTDLIHWEQIGHVLDTPEQLQLSNIRTSGGIYAPTIRYNELDDTFYLLCTVVDGIGNFIVSTKNPLDGWSQPVAITEIGGIDPSLFFDEDGKTYIVRNDAPAGTPEWEGHRAIWLCEYDMTANKVVGEQKVIIDGGVDKSYHPIWIEAPHIYKINGWYYLLCAEGGTAEDHSEVVFRSKNVWGPYIPGPVNPILTQRDLSADRPDKVTCAGHADIVEDNDGKWWAVFLACRPYLDNYYNLGRETFLLPVTWKNEFPSILPQGEAIALTTVAQETQWKTDFSQPLDYKWISLRTPDTTFYAIKDKALHLQRQNKSVRELTNPSFIGVRQQHNQFEVITQLDFTPQSEADLAGIVVFQSETFNYIFGKTLEGNEPFITVESTVDSTPTVIASLAIEKADSKKPIYLKVVGNDATISFYSSYDGKLWNPVAEQQDATILSTKKAGGFNGVIIGLYATSKK